MNLAVCCKQAVCTECYLQTRPPRKITPCPFCNHDQFNVRTRDTNPPLAPLPSSGKANATKCRPTMSMQQRLMSPPKPIIRKSRSAPQPVPVPTKTPPGSPPNSSASSPPLSSSSERRELEESMRAQRAEAMLARSASEEHYGASLGRRRTTTWGSAPAGGGLGGQRRVSAPGGGGRPAGALEALLEATGGQFPADLQQMEELMLMEAIRASLHAQSSDGAGTRQGVEGGGPGNGIGPPAAAGSSGDEGGETEATPSPVGRSVSFEGSESSEQGDSPYARTTISSSGSDGPAGGGGGSPGREEEDPLASLMSRLGAADEDEQLRLAIAMSLQDSPAPTPGTTPLASPALGPTPGPGAAPGATPGGIPEPLELDPDDSDDSEEEVELASVRTGGRGSGGGGGGSESGDEGDDRLALMSQAFSLLCECGLERDAAGAAAEKFGPQLIELHTMGFLQAARASAPAAARALELLERYQGRLLRVANALSEDEIAKGAFAAGTASTPGAQDDDEEEEYEGGDATESSAEADSAIGPAAESTPLPEPPAAEAVPPDHANLDLGGDPDGKVENEEDATLTPLCRLHPASRDSPDTIEVGSGGSLNTLDGEDSEEGQSSTASTKSAVCPVPPAQEADT